MIAGAEDQYRIVITGIGVAAPNGNSLTEFRQNLLSGQSGVTNYNIRYVGDTHAGVCTFDELRHQKKKEVRRGTRAGSIGIYCAHEADRRRWTGLAQCRSRHRRHLYRRHRARQRRDRERNLPAQGLRLRHQVLVAPPQSAHRGQQPGRRNLAESGNHRSSLHDRRRLCRRQCGLDPRAQMLLLGECDVALAGGVSESIHTFGIFASFASQGALARHDDPTKASRPFDRGRNGIVVAEGGCILRARAALRRQSS